MKWGPRRLRPAPSWWLLAAALALVAVVAGEAFGRVGGGQSYSGGGGGGRSGGGGGGGGDGGGAIVELLLWLVIRHPTVGIPVTLGVLVVVIIVKVRSPGGESGFSESAHVAYGTAHDPRPAGAEALVRGIRELRQFDPAFSRFVFIDFCSLLYTRFHETRGRDNAVIAAYLAPDMLQRAAQEAIDNVERVVIGSLRLTEVELFGGDMARVTAQVESNVDEVVGGRRERVYYQEQLVFERRRDVLSPAPDVANALACPSCGAATDLDLEGRCRFCHNVVNHGDFGWVLVRLATITRRAERRLEPKLDRGGEETGYRLPTVYQANYQAAKRAFHGRNPEFSWGRFSEHVNHVFRELQAAWSSLQWERARPYETDYLFQTHRFWIERYKADGLVNKLEDIVIEQIQACRIERDPFYETVTVRIFVSMKDYTVDAAGKVVGGNKRIDRKFSEYWTFLRRSGVEERADREPEQCPSCGAALKISQAGVCEFCQAKVVTGEFGWTLALIEQDESYVP